MDASGKITVLVLERDPNLCRWLGRLLEDSGLFTHLGCRPDPATLLQAAASLGPGLILLDGLPPGPPPAWPPGPMLVLLEPQPPANRRRLARLAGVHEVVCRDRLPEELEGLHRQLCPKAGGKTEVSGRD